ncbi:hypothetical protein JXM67_12710 [candidate division WOR-3 bacterium]|nr:hypothetical protein [candidate division WOR-3 bacterium]
MVKVRYKFAEFIGRLGDKVFSKLSQLEECGIFPHTSRFLKLYVLGFLVVLIDSLTAQPEVIQTMCYDLTFIPDVYVTHIKSEPNPTNGADSVTVTAEASVTGENTEGTYISGASIRISEDSIPFLMKAVDGDFDEASEELVGRISVETLEPGTTWVYVTAVTSNEGSETQCFWLLVNKASETTQ